MLNEWTHSWWWDTWLNARAEEILANTNWHWTDYWISELETLVQDEVKATIIYTDILATGDQIGGTIHKIERVWETVAIGWRNATFVYYGKNWFYINTVTRRPLVTKWRTGYIIYNLNPIDPKTILDYKKVWVKDYFNIFINLDTLEPLRVNGKLVIDVKELREWKYIIKTDSYDSCEVDTTIDWWENTPFIEEKPKKPKNIK